MPYDPDTSPERQVQDWVCSIRTATWMLRSIGCDVTAGEMQDAMVPRLVTPELGLLDGSGEGLGEFLAERSGLPTGVHQGVTWDWLQQHAGDVGPIGMGSHKLYHWVAVRDWQDANTLELMNPAPGYRGLHDTMTKQQFYEWGPWNAVYIDMPVDEPAPSREAELETTLGYLTVKVADALQTALNSALTASNSRGRADAFEALQAAINSLKNAGRDA